MFTNNINKKKYVGKSNDLFTRFRQYQSKLHKVDKYNTNINRAFSKFGPSNFTVTLLEYCEKQDLGIREQYYIDKIKPQYNVRKSVHKTQNTKAVKKDEKKKIKREDFSRTYIR